MSAIGSSQHINVYSQAFTATPTTGVQKEEPVVTKEVSTPAVSTESTISDEISSGTPLAKSPFSVGLKSAALAPMNHLSMPSTVGNSAMTNYQAVQNRTTHSPAFDEKAFNEWATRNLPDQKEPGKLMQKLIKEGHKLDGEAYKALRKFLVDQNLAQIIDPTVKQDPNKPAQGPIIGATATKNYSLNEFTPESHTVLYKDGDTYKEASFVKNEDGKWDMVAADGTVTNMETKSYAAARAKGLAKNPTYWELSGEGSDKHLDVRHHTTEGDITAKFINGTDKTKNQASFKVGQLKVGGEADQKHLGLNMNLKSWELNAKHLFDPEMMFGISQLNGKAGDLNGSTMVALRKSFGENFKLSASYAYMPNVDDGSQMVGLGAHYGKELIKTTNKDNTVSFSSNFEGNLAIPVMLGSADITDVASNSQFDLTSKSRLSWTPDSGNSYYVGYTANLDLAMAAANAAQGYDALPGLSQYAEFGATVATDGGKGKLTASLYAPITIHDSQFSDDFKLKLQYDHTLGSSWNFSGSVESSWDSTDFLTNMDLNFVYAKKYLLGVKAYNLSPNSKTSGVAVNFGLKF